MTKESALQEIDTIVKIATTTKNRGTKIPTDWVLAKLNEIRKSIEALDTSEDASATIPEEGISTLSSLPITKRQLVALALIPLCENLVDYSPSQKI